MKWDYKLPKFGDVIRVKAGVLYHYGLFVNEDQVVQFGLNPLARQNVKDNQVEVCITDIDGFLLDGDLERGVVQFKDGLRFSRKKSVKIAFSRLGQKGYNLLHNNCEHFVYECVFGKKKSEQTDDIRKKIAQIPILDVYVTTIPNDVEITKCQPLARYKEIIKCKSQKVQTQKYVGWKLLEYALKRTFGYKMSDLKFVKRKDGKWECDKCYFSISHSNLGVAVAISKKPVGVDIEFIKDVNGKAIERVLCEEERQSLIKGNALNDSVALLTVWSQKESLFKMEGKGGFKPVKINTVNAPVYTKKILINGQEYLLSTSSEILEKARYLQDVTLDFNSI